MFRRDVEDWICGYLSERTPEHNNLPRCPYAKKSLLKNTVWFEEATIEAQVLGIVERYSKNWDDDKHEAVIIHLNWDITDEERIEIGNSCLTFYGLNNDIVFIEERRTLGDTTYDMILMHRFSEMQVAKRYLKKKGYYANKD